MVRALFDGDLPIELSLKGARWKEGVFGFGDRFLARQAAAEERAARDDADIKGQTSHLKDELREADLAREEITDRALRRINAGGGDRKMGTPTLRSIGMTEGEDKLMDQDEDLLEFAARVRRERDERIAKIRETKVDVEPSHLQELIDTQAEFRESVMADLRAALS